MGTLSSRAAFSVSQALHTTGQDPRASSARGFNAHLGGAQASGLHPEAEPHSSGPSLISSLLRRECSATKSGWRAGLGSSPAEIPGELRSWERSSEDPVTMPVRRGHVAPQNTFLGTIIRKFEGQNKKFIIANARVQNCAIIYCNDGFCEMTGFSRPDVMQKPCTCDFLHGPETKRHDVAQIAQALLGSEERKVEVTYYHKNGSTFICNTHIIPVKNQEGVAMMFIINFEYVTDQENAASPQRVNPILPVKTVNRKLFGFKFPGLRVLSYRKQSLPQEDPDVVVIDSSKHSDDSVAMKHFKSPTKESCSPSEADDTKALIQPSKCSPLVNISGPLDHSSPKRQWDRLYPDMLQSSSQLTHSRSRESLCSIRRASSVHDMEGFSAHPKNIFRDRHASEDNGRNVKGPFNHIKSSLLGSTSDSNLNKYSTINKIPQLTLNFSDVKTEKKNTSPPSSDKTIIAPKVKDRTHNVTEKVTQAVVWCLAAILQGWQG